MSLSLIRKVFELMPTIQPWSVYLIKVRTSKKLNAPSVSYATMGITLKPNKKIDEFVNEIRAVYLEKGSKRGKGKLDEFSDVKNYDGSVETTSIYKLASTNILIETALKDLLGALSEPEMDGDPREFGANAYVLKTTMHIDENDVPVLLFSMQKPITVLKNKFLYEENVFKQIDKKVLSLQQTFDVIMVGNTVYLMTMAGENLFNMEHSYKKICDYWVNKIGKSDVLSDFDTFSRIAKSSHNPRKFIAFDEARFEMIKNREERQSKAKLFSIALSEDGKIDTKEEEAANKLVKVLCNKGMVDPFKNVPVEVPSSSRWIP